LILICSCYVSSFSQVSKVDSLKNLLLTEKNDTTRAILLGGIGRAYTNVSDFERGLEYSREQLHLAERINYKTGIIAGNNNLGLVYFYRGDFPKCLNYYFKALKVAEESGNKIKACKILANIASVYYVLNDFTKALDMSIKTLEMAKTLGDSTTIAAQYSQIGLVYQHEAKTNKKGAERTTIYEKALGNYFNAVLIDSLLGNWQNMSSYLINIATLYEETRRPEKALAYHLYSIRLKRQISDTYGLGIAYGNLGTFYINNANYLAADTSLHRALEISEQTGDMEGIMEVNLSLSQLYGKQNDWKRSMEHYMNYIAARDTITNEANTKKQLETAMAYEYDKKETELKAVAKQEKEKQQLVLYGVCLGLFLVILFAGFMYNRFKVTQKQKKLIEIKEQETQLQKELILAKNNEILSSIRYAKRIQQSLLPQETYIAKVLKRKD
jgi:tetratricopeptide (TPR) repeat protein